MQPYEHGQLEALSEPLLPYRSCDNGWEWYSLVPPVTHTIAGKGSSKHSCSSKQAKHADDGEDNSL